MPLRLLGVSALLFGSGACALAYQLVWTRELRLVFGHSTAASAAVLAIFIFGLGAGSLLLGPRADGHPRPLAPLRAPRGHGRPVGGTHSPAAHRGARLLPRPSGAALPSAPSSGRSFACSSRLWCSRCPPCSWGARSPRRPARWKVKATRAGGAPPCSTVPTPWGRSRAPSSPPSSPSSGWAREARSSRRARSTWGWRWRRAASGRRGRAATGEPTRPEAAATPERHAGRDRPTDVRARLRRRRRASRSSCSSSSGTGCSRRCSGAPCSPSA